MTRGSKKFSLRLTLQLKRSLGGYSHRERCRAPDRTHEKVKIRGSGRSRRNSVLLKGVTNTSPQGVEESALQELQTQLIARPPAWIHQSKYKESTIFG